MPPVLRQGKCNPQQVAFKYRSTTLRGAPTSIGEWKIQNTVGKYNLDFQFSSCLHGLSGYELHSLGIQQVRIGRNTKRPNFFYSAGYRGWQMDGDSPTIDRCIPVLENRLPKNLVTV